MSTPTTARGALLRRAGTLLVAAALVGATATSALADTTPQPSPTASGTTTSPAATASPSPSPTGSTITPDETTPAPDPSVEASTSASSPTPTPSLTTDPGDAALTGDDPALVPGGRLQSFGPAAADGPATSSDPALLAAGYLERELTTSGNTLPIVYDGVEYPQYGLVADAVLALDAAGAAQTAAASATTFLSQHVVDYVGFGDPKEVAAGSVAKLLNVAAAQAVDPTAFGGIDLVSTLEGLEQPNGRFSDVSTYGDNSNTFGQSFALIGLTRAGRTTSTEARAYLLAQQCPGGGFQLYMADAGCSSDADADPDATAMAVQALLAVGGASTAAGEALDYLASLQGTSGGVGGGGPNVGANANSTGLAGQAFLAGGRTTEAQSAVGYLSALQYGCDFAASLRGGIAYDSEAYQGQADAGAAAEPLDQDRRSTSQALLALAGTPLASVTAVGATADAPSLTCASPTTTSGAGATPTGGAGQGTGSGSGSTSGAGTDASAPGRAGGISSPTGSLAQTGSDLLRPALLGLLLVVLGALAVIASRRRGAHA